MNILKLTLGSGATTLGSVKATSHQQTSAPSKPPQTGLAVPVRMVSLVLGTEAI
jgi:hypothetical protein